MESVWPIQMLGEGKSPHEQRNGADNLSTDWVRHWLLLWCDLCRLLPQLASAAALAPVPQFPISRPQCTTSRIGSGVPSSPAHIAAAQSTCLPPNPKRTS